MNEQPPPKLHELHAVLQRNGKVENMFERAAVVHHIKALLELIADRLVQVMHNLSSFEIRGIEGAYVFGSERTEEWFGILRILPANRERFAGQVRPFEHLHQLRRINIEVLAPDPEPSPKPKPDLVAGNHEMDGLLARTRA